MALNNKVFVALHTLPRYSNIGDTAKLVFSVWSPTFLHSTEAGIFFSQKLHVVFICSHASLQLQDTAGDWECYSMFIWSRLFGIESQFHHEWTMWLWASCWHCFPPVKQGWSYCSLRVSVKINELINMCQVLKIMSARSWTPYMYVLFYISITITIILLNTLCSWSQILLTKWHSWQVTGFERLALGNNRYYVFGKLERWFYNTMYSVFSYKRIGRCLLNCAVLGSWRMRLSWLNFTYFDLFKNYQKHRIFIYLIRGLKHVKSIYQAFKN